MVVRDWLFGLFNKEGIMSLEVFMGELAKEVFFKELAIQACINLIAGTVSRSEFLTYEKGKEIRGENYYLFNVEPNQNKNAAKFWSEVIDKLVYDGYCLVIQQDNMFYVADSYTVKRYAFKENIYSNVVIEGYSLRNSYLESQVFHFEQRNTKIKTVIDGLYQSYSKLLSASMASFIKNSAKRGSLEIPASYPQTDKAQEELNTLLSKRFKKFFEAEGGAVLPLTGGLKYAEMVGSVYSPASVSKGIRGLVDDVFDFVGMAFLVPPQLLKGSVADTEMAVNNFLAFCVNPLTKVLADEINRKLYKKEKYLERTYLKIDTSRVRVTKITDVAGSLDILLRIGAYSVDDCLRTLGMEPLNTDWSRARWMTKNYEPIEQSYEGRE